MSDLIKRLGWTTSLAFSAALIAAGCGGEPGDMDGDGLDSNIEVVEPSPEGIPSTGMDPMPAPDLGTDPAPDLGTDPAPDLGTDPAPVEPEIEPTPDLEVEPAPADPSAETPAPEQP